MPVSFIFSNTKFFAITFPLQFNNLRNSKKNEKVETHSKKLLKEKKEISKANEILTNKIKIKVREEELFDYIKKGKKRAKKNYEKYMLEENCSQEKENSNNYKRKNKKFNRNERYENTPNELFENEKNNKKMKFEKECEKLCINRNYIREENIQRNYIIEFLVKCMIKLNKINIISLYVFILNISFFIQFVECNHRKIELFSSYINLKTIGTGQIRVFSSYYDKNNYPTAIIINNRINHTNSEINNEYYLDNEENNITLIWDEPPTTTTKMFKNCKNIIEIDLSNFKTNNVTTMEGMFSW